MENEQNNNIKKKVKRKKKKTLPEIKRSVGRPRVEKPFKEKRPVGRPRIERPFVEKRPRGRPKKVIDPNAPLKPKPPAKPRGRPRILFPYKTARQIAQAEGLTSKEDYTRWWKYNLPYRMPKRPDRSYKNLNFSWNDFLGNTTKFPTPYQRYRTIEECKAYTVTLGLKGRTDWLLFAKSGKKPLDIPARPDLYYRRHKRNWISWRDFLNVSLVDKHEQLVIAKRVIFYIIKLPHRPQNVYQFGVIMDKNKLLEAQTNNQIRIVRMFYLNAIDDPWLEIVERFCYPYAHAQENNEYATNDYYDLIEYLSENFGQVL